MAGVLFEDIFDVKDIDPDGKKFDRGKKVPFCGMLLCLLTMYSYTPNPTPPPHKSPDKGMFLAKILVLAAAYVVAFLYNSID